MAQMRVNPTRMEMKKLQGKLATARRGHKLLKDKRDELMKQFLDIVRANKELREAVEARLMTVHASMSIAASLSSSKMLEEALMLPKTEGVLSVSYRNMMSVDLPVFDFALRGAGAGGQSYGFAFTSGELDAAIAQLSELLPDLIKLAELEKTAQMLAEEIEKTRRRVNALEYIMIPQYQESIRSIKMKLDENERGNTVRLMKVKDLAVAKALAEAQKRKAE
ncbi:MAG: V-type ATP synthase subunit D [Clostridia bacterium]|nr:V-type ATP synthase subunit D [Clostridia bacterium]